ncbi:MAG: CoA transferase, partial [Dehalococcoidia bacterium]
RDDQWVTLMKGMGKEEFAQPEFADLQWRLQNQDALQIIIEEWLQEQFATPEEAVSFLADQLGLAAAPVLTVGQFTRNPHLARRIVGRVQDPFLGELLALESPQKLSETPPRIYRRAPYLGEHNESILRDILQYPAEHIQHLREAGVLVEEPELAKVRQREGNAS